MSHFEWPAYTVYSARHHSDYVQMFTNRQLLDADLPLDIAVVLGLLLHRRNLPGTCDLRQSSF